MKEEWKVYIRGNLNRSKEVIKALTDLGANNSVLELEGVDRGRIYYINHDGNICMEYIFSEYAKIIMDNYKEIKLPKEWPDGCILKSNLFRDTFGVFRQTCEDAPERFEGYAFVDSKGIEGYKRPLKMSYRIATPQEIDKFHELLHKRGNDWDYEKKQLVNWRWRPKMYDEYWGAAAEGVVDDFIWHEDPSDKRFFDFGNCFRTLSERQLKLLAYACRVTDRLIIGQLDFSLQECCESAFEKLYKGKEAGKIGSNEWYYVQYEVTEAIQKLRKLCWGVEHGQNHGIHYDNTADILFDMQKVMEHALWLEEDPEKRSNWTNDAFEHTSPIGDEKNIKVKKI